MRAHIPLSIRSAPASVGRCRENWNAQGFSLTELMVAIAIGMIITLALGLLMTENMNARANLQQKGERLENGRFALDVLGNDLALAGYFGGYWPFYKDRVFASGTGWHWEYRETASATWSSYASLCPAAPFGWDPGGPGVPQPIMGIASASVTLNSGNAPCLWLKEDGDTYDADELELQSNSDIVVVNRVSTTPTVASQSVASSSATSPDDFYLQVSDCYGAQESGQAYDTVPFSLSKLPVTSAAALKRGDCTSPAVARKYISHVYYVACMPNCADPKNIPTLHRVELLRNEAASKYRRSVPLVPGIERLKVQFGEDSAPGDGIMDGDFKAAGGVGNWSNVVTARVFVVARDLNAVVSPSEFQDTKVFYWPESGVLVASAPAASSPAAKYQRQSFTTVVNLTNISGRRE